MFDEIKNNLKQLKHDRNAALKYKETKDLWNLAKAQMAYKKKEQAELEISSLNEHIEKYENGRVGHGPPQESAGQWSR